jgi:CDGSH-type Zn-finger protein
LFYVDFNKNGSIKIDLDFELKIKVGVLFGLEGLKALELCRCGLSFYKPFCDGSYSSNFEWDSKAFDVLQKKMK